MKTLAVSGSITLCCAILAFSWQSGSGFRRLASGEPTIREQSRAVVARCEESVAPSEISTKITYVIDESDHICERRRVLPDWTSGSDVSYDIQRLESGFFINLGIRAGFHLKHSYSDPSEMIEKLNACAPLIASVWKRYGIDFQLWFTTASDANYNLGIDVYDDDYNDGTERRSNSSELYYGGMKNGPTDSCRSGCQSACKGDLWEKSVCAGSCIAICEPVRQDEVCLTLLHETGHMVGLPDEYADSECPDRTTVRKYGAPNPPPWSVMENEHVGWDKIEFYPEHLETVLKPICG